MTVSSRASRRQLVVLGLAAALAVAGCAAPTTVISAPGGTTVPAGTSAGVELGTAPAPGAPGDVAVSSVSPAGGDAGTAMTAWDPVVIDASLPVGPENDCAGVDQTATDFTRLTADDQVSEIVVCGSGVGYLPGDGTWNLVSEHRVPAERLPALVDGLRRPDIVLPPDTACSLILVMVPTFTVVTTDGRRLKGSVPSDGCHPQDDVVGLINEMVADQPADKQWRTTRSQTEAELTTSCPPENKEAGWPPATGPDGVGAAPVPVQVPADTSAAGAEVCRYAASVTLDPTVPDSAPTTAPQASPTRDSVVPPTGGAVGEPAIPSPGSAGADTTPLLGTGRIDAALYDRLIDSITTTTPSGRPSCSATDPWTTAGDGLGQLVLATPPTRTAAGVPQPGYPYLILETGSCGRVLTDSGYSLAGWADPQVVAQVRAAVGG